MKMFLGSWTMMKDLFVDAYIQQDGKVYTACNDIE